MCFENHCSKHASYNFEGEKALYCSKHKQEGMIDVVSKRCINQGCYTQPVYNYIGEKPLYCS